MEDNALGEWPTFLTTGNFFVASDSPDFLSCGVMIAWIVAILIVGLVAVVGYYQGALRAALSFIGLILGAMLAMPLSGITGWILELVGVKHPVTLAFLAPILAWILVLAVFKVVANTVHRKVDTYYKYKASDTRRGLWERLNQRLGICVGIANGVVYVFIISVIFYTMGYFTTQVEAEAGNPFATRIVNAFARDLDASNMDKAIGGLTPAEPAYFDAADVLGGIYHNPLLQNRVAQYPSFLSLAERPEFTAIGSDVNFQEQLWLKQPRPPVNALINHERLKPITKDPQMFKTVWALAKPDIADLKAYVESGRSPKYDEHKILGRWAFDYRESFARARKAKPLMTLADIRAARSVMTALNNSIFTAMVDHKAIFKVASSNKTEVLEGTWQAGSDGSYVASFSEGGKSLDVPITVEYSKLLLSREGQTLVFEK